MGIRFLAGETIDGALTVNNTITLSGANNTAATFTLTNTAPTPDSTWTFVPQYNSQDLVITGTGKFDVVSSGGTGRIDTNGQIESIQALDVATAGGRFTGKSNRGSLGSIHIEQTTTNADGGYINLRTSASGSTNPTERFRITDTGAFSVGPSGTNYGSSGQVLTSQGNGVPAWATPTTGTVTGSGTTNAVTKFTAATAIGDGPITFATNDSTFAGTLNALGGLGGYYMHAVSGNSSPGGNNPAWAILNNTTISSATYGWGWYDSNADGSFQLWRRNNSTTANHVLTFDRGNSNATFAGNVELKSDAGNATKHLRIWNEGTAANDDAVLSWTAQASRTYSMGIHRDSGNLVISNADASVASGDLINVNTSGNVGIGTDSPGAKLEVLADVAKGVLINRTFTTSSQTLANIRAYYALAITPFRGGTGGLYFTNYDADVPIIQSVNTSDVAQSLLLNPLGGNVGIGTTSPTAKLTIDNSISTTYSTTGYAATPANSMLYLNNTHGGSNTASLINFRAGSGDGVLGFVEGGGTNDADFIIQTDGGSNGIERFRILNNGNVGIGTTTPAANLQVGSNPDPAQTAESLVHLLSSTASSTVNGFAHLKLDYHGGVTQYDPGATIMFNQSYHSGNLDYTQPTGAIRGYRTTPTQYGYGGGVQLLYQPSTPLGILPGLSLDHVGNVGIGTNAPVSKLHIQGGDIGVTTGQKIGWIYNPGGDNNMYNYLKTADDGGFPASHLEISGANWTSGNVAGVKFTHVVTGDLMTIMTGGKVGIGVTDPDSRLDVNAGVSAITAGPAVRISKGASPAGLIAYDTLVIEANDVPTIRFAESDGTVSTITSGDSNMRINSTSPIKFFTAGTTTGEGHGGQGGTFAMIINNSQNVGIGTTAPGYKLEVQEITGGADQTVAHFGAHLYGEPSYTTYINLGTEYGDGTSRIGSINTTGNQSSLVFETHAAGSGSFTERMRIDNSGKVGIGDVSPAKLLSLWSSETTNTAQLDIQDSSSGAHAYLGTFSNNMYLTFGGTYSSGWASDGTRAIAGIVMSSAAADSNISFQTTATNNAGPTTQMTITKDGNVGIGTTAPAYQLQITSPHTYPSTTVDTFYADKGCVIGSSGDVRQIPALDIKLKSGGENIRLTDFDGIGSGFGPYMSFYDGGASVRRGFIQCVEDGSEAKIKIAVEYGGFEVWTGDNNNEAERMRITSDGTLLIGCTSEGNTNAYFSLESNDRSVLALGTSTTHQSTVAVFRNPNGGVGSVSVSGSATAYNTSSDYRLKEDLKDFNGLDMVSKIPVYDFKWKTDESRSYGVMAHELQKVLPQAVTGNKDAEEMQGVDYSKIVPMLIKSVQELKIEIEELKIKIK